ncbi:MAG: WD40 repeat domain-containing protein, partial [Candidatus Omnitrophota bacterium]
MIISITKQRHTFVYRCFSLVVVIAFSLSLLATPSPAYAQAMLNLPQPGVMIPLSPGFNPAILRGIKVFPEEPFRFDFIVDAGQSNLKGKALEEESAKLIKYFLASLTIPEDDLWVNLSPYEDGRVIPEAFGRTEMGRDLLAQDYLLKQVTASLVYPEHEPGAKFWDKVYKRAYEKFGTTEIPVNAFNKVWVIPAKAVVYTHGGTAFVVESRLKVMLETDYVALQENGKTKGDNRFSNSVSPSSFQKENQEISEQVIREIILPEIEKEINEGKNFAQLRQIYHSMILATWFKKNLKESVLGKVYVDQNKVLGVDIEDKEAKEKIYKQYLEAFKKGVYDYIKEDYDSATQKIIPRKYFSGGVQLQFGPGVNAAMSVEEKGVPAIKAAVGDGGIIISGEMKAIGVREADGPELDLSDRHAEFEALAESGGKQNLFSGSDAEGMPAWTNIDYFLAKASLPDNAGSYYFKSPKLGWIIVLNDQLPDNEKIRSEALIHELIEIFLRTKLFKPGEDTYENERIAHIIASALQRTNLPKASTGLTYYDQYQLNRMTLKQLNALKEEYEAGRTWHKEILKQAASKMPLDLDKVEQYEKGFYSHVLLLIMAKKVSQAILDTESLEKYKYKTLPFLTPKKFYSAIYQTTDPAMIGPTSDDLTVPDWAQAKENEGFHIVHDGIVEQAIYSPDGKTIVTASWDGTAKVWDAKTGNLIKTLTGHKGTVTGASYSPDGKTIVTASLDGKAKVWDAQTGNPIATLTGHAEGIRAVSFSPDGKTIVTASGDKTAKVWDAKTGNPITTLTGHMSTVTCASYSPDGKVIVTASHDGTARVWDAKTGNPIATLTGHTEGIRAASFSPDGKTIVTASTDGKAKVWDAQTGNLIKTLTGHTEGIRAASFSPDGKTIVTASHDGTARVWDAKTGNPIATLTGHTEGIRAASF